jgi:hypothetical protein
MMIDISRLRQSDFDAITDDSAWRAGVNLWFSAWHSVPAGSLSADDGSLAKAAGLGRDLRTWRKVKQDALRGFQACSDGRLYHETVCEFALEAWLEKLVQRISSGAGNAKRWGGEFDPAPIEREIDRVADMLAAIAPQSKAIPKAKRRHSRSSPSGTPETSHRDAPDIPVGSQGKGKGNLLPLPDGNGAVPLPDPEKIMFDGAVAMLTAAGKSETQARSITGKWKRDYGAEAVISALARAKREGAIEPVSFIEGCLKQRGRDARTGGGHMVLGI